MKENRGLGHGFLYWKNYDENRAKEIVWKKDIGIKSKNA